MAKITREVIVRFFLTGDDLLLPNANEIEGELENVIRDWNSYHVDCELWLLRTVIDDVLWERG